MPFPTAHALLIAPGSYAHAPQLNVPITAADAGAVAAVLRDPQYCGYLPEQVTLLSDAAASRDGLLVALDGLAARAGEGDTVVVFYAGHGDYGDDGYYLTTHDTRLAGRKVAVGTGIREAELIAKLRAIKAKRLLLIINACHSGEISPVLAPGEEPLTGAPLPPQVSAALLGTGEGRVIISACRESQYSFIGPGPLTLFTQALVDGLQGKGVSSNRGYISVFDLYTHLYFALDEAVPRKVSAAVRQRYGEKQEPELTILKGVGPFAVTLYRGATTLGDFDASGDPPEGTAVREVNPAYSQAMLRQHQQSISGNVQVGAAIAGDVHGNITVDQSGQRGGLSFGSDSQLGDVSVRDVAGSDINRTETTQGDRITTGDISGTGIAIGRGARSSVRNIDTGGGDYAEGDIDKRRGTFVRGDQYNLFFTAAGIADPSAEQRELVAAYLSRLAQRCDRLRLSGAVRRERRDAGKPLTLSQVYVTLAAETWEPVRKAKSENAFAKELAAGNPDDVLPETARRIVELQREGELATAAKRSGGQRYRLERPLLLTEALSRRRQLVLLGGPGSGKSSFLRHLAVALAQTEQAELPGGWSAGRLLPLYASLGAFAAWTQQQPTALLDGPGLWRYLLATAQEYGLEGLDQPLKRAFRQGGLLLLLDGLDEVADPALRAGVARAVAALGDAGGYLAITCRVRSFAGAVAEPFAAWGVPVTLAPFSLGQMRHFVQAWYARSAERGAIEPDEAAQRVQELTDRLARLSSLRDLGQTPLLLTIITILHYYEGKLPEDRADLYEDLVQLLLTRWTQQRREAGAPPALIDELKADKTLGGLKEFHLRNALELLAYRAHQESPASDGRGLLDRHRVRGAFHDLFAEFELGPGPAAEKAERVLTHLEHESGLLLPEGGDLYGLPHLSYEEYLAGCYLGQQAQFRELAYSHWQADPGRWREVIFLALGRMVIGKGREAAADWLAFLLAPAHGERVRDPAERQRAAFFAYECLAEMGGKAALIGASTVALPELWTSLAEGLAQVVEGAALPASDRVQAGVWLGELGDPRIPVTRDAWRVAGSPQLHPAPPLTRYWRPIPAGTFVIGFMPAEIKRLPRDEQGYFSNTENEVAVAIDTFELARYPLTNAQYARFMEAGGYDPEATWWQADPDGQQWLRGDRRRAPGFWKDARFGIARPNHPVVGVNWYEAVAFCRWLTQHLNDGYVYVLPSEAEWEYVARGSERRMYPWGNDEPDLERASYNQKYGITTLAVGCFPRGATPEGILDLAGTVWEWTRSEYRSYPYNPADGREDGVDPTQKRFTLRGGSWDKPPIFLRAATRDLLTPDYH